jgi:thiamine-phosphate pyrophosphorylase
MFLYYITDRRQFPGTNGDQSQALLNRMASAARAGIDHIQLREKDLSAKELETLAREALKIVRDHGPSTRLLINSRIDVALSIGADGVHLTATDILPSDARAIWASSDSATRSGTLPSSWVVGVSCHSQSEVRVAESHGADFAVLAPIFEKPGANTPALGLEALRLATRKGELPDTRVEAGDQRAKIPVFALGGITAANARQCIRHGASGIAGIRLFQQGDIAETVKILRQQL